MSSTAKRASQVQSTEEPSDEGLALALMAGDPRAPRVAVQRFSSLVRGIVRSFFRSLADVDDCQQEAFFALFRSIHNLREPRALRPFIITLTLRTARQHLRRLRNAETLGTPSSAILDRVHARTDVSAEHAFARFELLVSTVRARDRVPFLLRHLAGMDAPEVARRLGVSVPTVRRRSGRASERLEMLARRDLFLLDYVSQP